MKRALAIITLLALMTMSKQFGLTLIWSHNAGGSIEGLAFSDNGDLGVASSNGCAYVFDLNGNIMNKICGSDEMTDASYSSGRFGFVNDDGYAYIADENGKFINKVYVGKERSDAITLTNDGFVACNERCAFFDLRGYKKWDVYVGEVDNGPAYYKGYWYVADTDWNKLLIIKDGRIVNTISYGEEALDTAVCGNRLAVSSEYHLYLYDLSNPIHPKKLWDKGGFGKAYQVAFSPDCKYIAVVDADYHRLSVYDIDGNLVLEKYYGRNRYDEVHSVAWWRDRIAVGFESGNIYMYRVTGYNLATVSHKPKVTIPQVSGNISKPTGYKSVVPSGLKDFNKTLTYMDEFYTTFLKHSTDAAIKYIRQPLIKLLNNMTDVFAISALFKHALQLLSDLDASIYKINQTLQTIPTDVAKMRSRDLIKLREVLFEIEAAKVNALLLNNTLKQIDSIVSNISYAKPCSKAAKAKELLYNLINAKNLLQVMNARVKLENEFGSVNNALKCMLDDTLSTIARNWQKAKDEFYKKEIKDLRILNLYSQAIKMLIG